MVQFRHQVLKANLRRICGQVMQAATLVHYCYSPVPGFVTGKGHGTE